MGLTREAILLAADAFDVDELSMPKLAAALGVSHAALYHWFPNKQALIRAVIETALQDVHLPEVGDASWQDVIVEAASALREILASRSQYLPHVAVSASAAASPLSERILDTLAAGGFTVHEAIQLTELVVAWCFYSTWQSSYLDSHGLNSEAAMSGELDDLGVAPASRLRSLISRYSSHTAEERFRQNLVELLDRFSRDRT